MPKRKSKRRASKISKSKNYILPIKNIDKNKNKTKPLFVIDKKGDINKKIKYRTKLLSSHKILGINKIKTEPNKKQLKHAELELKKYVKKIERNPEQLTEKKKRKKREIKYDLWEDDVDTSSKSTEPKLKYKPTGLKAIETPKTEASYNPSFESHQKAMSQVLAKTLQAEKIEKKLIRQLSVRPELKAMKDPNRDERITQIIHDIDNPIPLAQDQEDEVVINDPIKRNHKRVTEKKRNQMKRKKLKNISKIREKVKNKLKTKVHRVLPLKEKVEQILEKRRNIIKLRKLKKAESLKTETKDLGPNKFEETIDFESVLTSDQLTGSLRTIPKHKNLIHNTFESFQKRNLIEPRKRTEKKKARTSRVVIFSKKREWHDLEKELTKNL